MSLTEDNIIGAFFMDPLRAYNDVKAAGLRPEMFSGLTHRRACSVCLDMVERGLTPDKDSLILAMDGENNTEILVLVDLWDQRFPSMDNLRGYIDITRRTWMARECKALASTLMEYTDGDGDIAVEKMEALCLKLRAGDKPERSTEEIAREQDRRWQSAYDAMQRGEIASVGVPSEHIGITRLTGGYQRGAMVVLSGPEKAGKSMFAANDAVFQARQGIPAAYVTLEMSPEQIVGRAAGSEAGVSTFLMDTGSRGVSPEDREIVRNALTGIGSLPLHFYDKSGTVGEIAGWIRTKVRTNKVEVVYIDHLDLITPDQRYSGTYERVSETVKILGNLARDTGVAMVCLHQLSTAYQKENRPPDSRDLRDSGKIAHQCHWCGILYQDKWGKWNDENKMIFTIPLNRSGPTGMVLFNREMERQRFTQCSIREVDEWKECKSTTSGSR